MSEFMYLFRGGDAARASSSPEAMQAHMEKWKTWMGGLAEKGILISGLPLKAEGRVVTGGGSVVTDGPFAEGSEVVGGFLMIKANSFDEAVTISKQCPIFEHKGTVEIRETAEM